VKLHHPWVGSIGKGKKKIPFIFAKIPANCGSRDERYGEGNEGEVTCHLF
jgi:hypothetical protein